MTREWKPAPGDVAVVCNAFGVWNVAICSLAVGARGFVWKFGVADSMLPVDGPDARPLLVIDAEDAATAERLAVAWGMVETAEFDDVPLTVAGLRMREALRSLLAPPKPDEPQGLGAVVEDGRKVVWIRTDQHPDVPWQRRDIDCGQGDWSDVAAPVRVLSEGVTS